MRARSSTLTFVSLKCVNYFPIIISRCSLSSVEWERPIGRHGCEQPCTSFFSVASATINRTIFRAGSFGTSAKLRSREKRDLQPHLASFILIPERRTTDTRAYLSPTTTASRIYVRARRASRRDCHFHKSTGLGLNCNLLQRRAFRLRWHLIARHRVTLLRIRLWPLTKQAIGKRPPAVLIKELARSIPLPSPLSIVDCIFYLN